MKQASKIEYKQDYAKNITNTLHGDVYNRNNNYYAVKNIVMNRKDAPGKESSKTAALAAYLSSTGKTPAQLAKELSTTAGNVKRWLRGCEIEIDYWLQLEPLLEEFLNKPRKSKISIAALKDPKEPLSVDEAIFLRKYRNLLPHQKIEIHKHLDQMEINNIDQQWDNAGVSDKKETYGLKAFSINIAVNSQDDLNRFVTVLDKNITVISGIPRKNKKNSYNLNIITTKVEDSLELYLKELAEKNNCVILKVSKQIKTSK